MSLMCIFGVAFALLVSAHVSTNRGTQAAFLFLEKYRNSAYAVTEKEKAEIVNKHNELRRGVNPPASDMLEMSWSDEAAANAQKWADGCSMGHSPSTERKISTSGCGENLYMSTTKDSWSAAIQDWYDEVNNFEYGVGSTNGKEVGHYTQVVWYRSNKVGCGMATCGGWNFYVCQYCPPGNYNEQRPYAEGQTCSKCANACNDKLCTNPCPYFDLYSNCDSLSKMTCGNPVGGWCPASCKCHNEIK